MTTTVKPEWWKLQRLRLTITHGPDKILALLYRMIRPVARDNCGFWRHPFIVNPQRGSEINSTCYMCMALLENVRIAYSLTSITVWRIMENLEISILPPKDLRLWAVNLHFCSPVIYAASHMRPLSLSQIWAHIVLNTKTLWQWTARNSLRILPPPLRWHRTPTIHHLQLRRE